MKLLIIAALAILTPTSSHAGDSAYTCEVACGEQVAYVSVPSRVSFIKSKHCLLGARMSLYGKGKRIIGKIQFTSKAPEVVPGHEAVLPNHVSYDAIKNEVTIDFPKTDKPEKDRFFGEGSNMVYEPGEMRFAQNGLIVVCNYRSIEDQTTILTRHNDEIIVDDGTLSSTWENFGLDK